MPRAGCKKKRMKFDDITNRLSEKQKQRLREAKTNEDLDSMFTAGKLELTDDQLGSVAGGTCFLPDWDGLDNSGIRES
jgi:hypothetical protein